MEEWKDVHGYEGLYQVSNQGRVKRLPRNYSLNNNPAIYVPERILKPKHYHKCGHLAVTLCKNGKQINKTVHGLVLEAFVGQRPKGMDIRHLDSDPSNNKLDNLAYGTRAENCIDQSKLGRCGSQKLTIEDVKQIRSCLANGEPMKDIAIRYGVTKQSVYAIKHRKSYAWLEG